MSLSTSYFKRSPLVIAISLALASPTFAESFIIADGDTETVQKQLINGQTGVIEVGGTLNTTGDAITATGPDNTITNSGSIDANGVYSDGIFSDGADAIITNSGTIDAADKGIVSYGYNATINNSGHITGTNRAVRGGWNDSLTLNLLKGSQLMGPLI